MRAKTKQDNDFQTWCRSRRLGGGVWCARNSRENKKARHADYAIAKLRGARRPADTCMELWQEGCSSGMFHTMSEADVGW